MQVDTPNLSSAGLQRFQALGNEAINAVIEIFHRHYGSDYGQFGERSLEECRDDLTFQLEFLRPVLEFGIVQPMVDYLRWFAQVLASRDAPADHIPISLAAFADFFAAHMEGEDGEIVVTALRQIKQRLIDAGNSEPFTPTPTSALEAWPECEAFESALLLGDRRTALALLEYRFERGFNLVDTEAHLIQPALYGIGDKWQRNAVSIAQEHMATAIAQSLMTQGLLKSMVPPANGSKVLLACVEGNIHSVGLQMVSDAFQLAGWDVQYLGANVPQASILQQVALYQPNLLGLSVSFPQQLGKVRQIIARLVESHGAARPAVIIGGLAINQFSRLAGQLGADAWSPNAHSVVAFANSINRQTAVT